MMRVQWTEFNAPAYRYALDHYPEQANPKDFEKNLEGNVIDQFQTFWGTPKFVVALNDGSITTVKMTDCKIVDYGKENPKIGF